MSRQPKKSPRESANIPDTARVYERAKPEFESVMGRLDSDKAPPADHADHVADGAKSKRVPHQINAEEEPKRGRRGK